MHVNARLTIKNNTGLVKSLGNNFADDFVTEVAKKAAEYAREKTKPGIGTSGITGGGPGPHPHRTPHYDTGALMRSIAVNGRHWGFLSTATVTSHLDYALYLEVGWHASNGKFYRYPWLGPSVEKATRDAEKIARIGVRRWFGGGWGRMDRGAQIIDTPLTWAIGE